MNKKADVEMVERDDLIRIAVWILFFLLAAGAVYLFLKKMGVI
jgi:hypothetical protein